MSHGEYSKEDARKDLTASLIGLGAGIVWILIVAFIAFQIALSAAAEHA